MKALQEVCIRPRKVFRELAATPVGAMDYLLSAAQGVAAVLFFCRMSNMGLKLSVSAIFVQALFLGFISGIAGIWLQSWIYTWLGQHTGGVAKRPQLMHVLAYGNTPMLVTLAIWVLVALVLGNQAFVEKPGDAEPFIVLLKGLQVAAYVLPAFWSVVLQIMGLSEMQQIRFRSAVGTWLLGQAIIALVALLLIRSAGIPLPQS